MYQKPKDFYVYLHRRKTDGKVFYVGKGRGDRAWQVNPARRSSHWIRVKKKYGYTVEIYLDGLQEWYSNELEVQLISYYGRENLCNFTDGGEGASGIAKTAETRNKLSASKKGKKRPDMVGDKNPAKKLESRMKISKNNAMKNEQSKIKMIISRKETTSSPEWIFNNSKENSHSAKKIICVETGVVFGAAVCALDWLKSNGKTKASQGNISSCCNGNYKTAYGFTWKYV